MDNTVKLVLKNKEGKITRELTLPLKNAAKLIGFKSGWVLSDNSGYKLTDGVLVPAKKESINKNASSK